MTGSDGSSEARELERTYAQNYWHLGNLITGFALAQLITFMVATGTSERLAERVMANRGLVATLTLVAGLLYALAVYCCHVQEMKLLDNAPLKILQSGKYIVWARIGIVLLANYVGVLVVLDII